MGYIFINWSVGMMRFRRSCKQTRQRLTSVIINIRLKLRTVKMKILSLALNAGEALRGKRSPLVFCAPRPWLPRLGAYDDDWTASVRTSDALKGIVFSVR